MDKYIHDTVSDPLIKKVTCVYISISIIQTAIFFTTILLSSTIVYIF